MTWFVRVIGFFLRKGKVLVQLKRFLPIREENNLFQERIKIMLYSAEVENMCPVAKGAYHGPAPIPQEGKWTQAMEIKDISGLTHGVGWCAPEQGACKLTLNVKEGIIEEALVETIGCSGMTHSAAMASEILPGKTLLEALNTDLVCDAINVAMRSGCGRIRSEGRARALRCLWHHRQDRC